jgi:cellobiose-specific phosphotransferase system component IIC
VATSEGAQVTVPLYLAGSIVVLVAGVAATTAWILALNITEHQRVCSHPLVDPHNCICGACGTVVPVRR